MDIDSNSSQNFNLSTDGAYNDATYHPGLSKEAHPDNRCSFSCPDTELRQKDSSAELQKKLMY
jgi:hypothetical protein